MKLKRIQQLVPILAVENTNTSFLGSWGSNFCIHTTYSFTWIRFREYETSFIGRQNEQNIIFPGNTWWGYLNTFKNRTIWQIDLTFLSIHNMKEFFQHNQKIFGQNQQWFQEFFNKSSYTERQYPRWVIDRRHSGRCLFWNPQVNSFIIPAHKGYFCNFQVIVNVRGSSNCNFHRFQI